MEHFKTACEPFYFYKEDMFTGTVERKVKHSDMIEEDKSLMNLVQQFIKQSPKHIQDQEAREAKEAKKEARLKQLEQIVERNMAKEQKEEDESKHGNLAGMGDIIIDSDNLEDI
jgi:hypothetical protein